MSAVPNMTRSDSRPSNACWTHVSTQWLPVQFVVHMNIEIDQSDYPEKQQIHEETLLNEMQTVSENVEIDETVQVDIQTKVHRSLDKNFIWQKLREGTNFWNKMKYKETSLAEGVQ